VLCVDAVNFGHEGTRSTVMVLSHGCEIDKPKRAACIVARITRFAEVDKSLHGYIRKGDVANALYLPTDPALGGEAYADLSELYRAPYANIDALEFREREGADGKKDRERLLGAARRDKPLEP
jgi:hypothetical protein